MADITCYRGQTLAIDCTVLDSGGAAPDLEATTNYFSYAPETKSLTRSSRAVVECTAAANLLSVTLAPSVTRALRGAYKYELWVVDGTDEYMVASGQMHVTDAIGH